MKGKTRQKIVVAVSGGFDPIHIGHVRMFEAARKLGDELVVILNNDNWIQNKKGYVFMNEKERKEILLALRPVDRVYVTKHTKDDQDTSVSKALLKLKPDIFANGGDRTSKNTPETKACEQIGAQMVFCVGRGGKV